MLHMTREYIISILGLIFIITSPHIYLKANSLQGLYRKLYQRICIVGGSIKMPFHGEQVASDYKVMSRRSNIFRLRNRAAWAVFPVEH